MDHPILGDADAVRPTPFARESIERLRETGIRVGVVSNQPGVAEGLFSQAQLALVNAHIDRMLGPFDVWWCCTHARSAGCACRKPQPGLIRDAAAALGVSPGECVVVGDIGSDMDAAAAAGARALLVPTDVTLRREIRAARTVAHNLRAAVDLILSGRV